MPAEIRLFRCRSDNYGVLLHDPETGATASIDAPEAAPIEAALKATGWKLTDILVTHHHADHTDGIQELKDKYKCRVVAPSADHRGREIGGRDRPAGNLLQILAPRRLAFVPGRELLALRFRLFLLLVRLRLSIHRLLEAREDDGRGDVVERRQRGGREGGFVEALACAQVPCDQARPSRTDCQGRR